MGVLYSLDAVLFSDEKIPKWQCDDDDDDELQTKLSNLRSDASADTRRSSCMLSSLM